MREVFAILFIAIKILKAWTSSTYDDEVACSSCVSHASASVALLPHMSAAGMSWPHTRGRSGFPKIRHWFVSFSCAQRMPAGLPCGIPGMAELMEGAMQQAPQPGRQFIDISSYY